jgi:hypothetical protein
MEHLTLSGTHPPFLCIKTEVVGEQSSKPKAAKNNGSTAELNRSAARFI